MGDAYQLQWYAWLQGDMPDKCALGVHAKQFIYQSKNAWSYLYDGHGIHVETECIGGDVFGVFFPYGNTIVFGDGGACLCDGDIITHDVVSCAKGLKRG